MTNIKGKKQNIYLNELMLLAILLFNLSGFSFSNEYDNRPCYWKIGEIGNNFRYKQNDLFYCISGICCDSFNNIYVIDSGYNKIFKFDLTTKLIATFGNEGQAKDEFLGSPRLGKHLRLSIGNDNKLYIMDPGNKKILIYSCLGEYIDENKYENNFLIDTPTVNSKGEMYLLSKNGMKLIDKYKSFHKYESSLFDFDYHIQFPLEKPSFPAFYLRTPNDYELIKLISKNDLLVVISNYSLKAFVFDERNKLIKEFNVGGETFKEDFKKRLNDQRSKLSSSSFILPFRAFIDKDGNICIAYVKSDGKTTIMIYDINGRFLRERLFCDRIKYGFITSNNRGDIILSSDNNTKIEIYQLRNSLKEDKK